MLYYSFELNAIYLLCKYWSSHDYIIFPANILTNSDFSMDLFQITIGYLNGKLISD